MLSKTPSKGRLLRRIFLLKTTRVHKARRCEGMFLFPKKQDKRRNQGYAPREAHVCEGHVHVHLVAATAVVRLSARAHRSYGRMCVGMQTTCIRPLGDCKNSWR